MTYRVNVSGVVLFNKKDEVLLINHIKKIKDGRYGFPGGKLEPRETRKECAIRELREETGLVTYKDGLFPLPKTYSKLSKKSVGVEVEYNMKMYYCNDWAGRKKKSREGTPEWFSTESVFNLPEGFCKPNLKKILLDCIDYRKKLTSIA